MPITFNCCEILKRSSTHRTFLLPRKLFIIVVPSRAHVIEVTGRRKLYSDTE
ncbi:hypothetical protein WN51_14376 [Melipona quadrifasciata]|uniref:Uncharacterized protein n=1 Tax=Melipona quadrifasciata TaxID=166423 RepID=A0A0M8ZXU6_9HYME|nr:hypothetical protein WN51_14376 [Melipona quadrifasciata]